MPVKIRVAFVELNYKFSCYFVNSPNDCFSVKNSNYYGVTADYSFNRYYSYYVVYFNMYDGHLNQSITISNKDYSDDFTFYGDKGTYYSDSSILSTDSIRSILVYISSYSYTNYFLFNYTGIDQNDTYGSYHTFIKSDGSKESSYGKCIFSYYNYYPDSDGEVDDLGIITIVVSCYCGVVLILLISIITIGCQHPNRLYRAGCHSECCFCCCPSTPYSSYEAYYATHYFLPFYFCCECQHHCVLDSHGGGRGNNVCGAILVLLILIVAIALILLPFILLSLLIRISCAYDDDERNYEAQLSRGNYNPSQNVTVTTTTVTNQPNSQYSSLIDPSHPNQQFTSAQQTPQYPAQPTPQYPAQPTPQYPAQQYPQYPQYQPQAPQYPQYQPQNAQYQPIMQYQPTEVSNPYEDQK
jgi:hypothetical protein